MKYYILINILFMLLARKKVTATEISSRFEISKRTVYRYIDELCIASVPITATHGPKGGFMIAESYKLPNLYFTESEFATLSSMLNSLKAQLSDSSGIAAIADKLASSMKDQKQINIVSSSLVIDGTGWTADKTFSKKLSVISSAIEKNQLLEIKYRDLGGEETLRRIEPHALALKSGLWYVYAYCRLRDDFRLFKISRIQYATPVGDFKKRPFDFKAKPICDWSQNANYEEVKLKIDPSVRSEIEEWLGVDNVYSIKGELFAEAILPYNRTLVSEIMRFGSNVKVLSPDKLIEDVYGSAYKILALYGQN